MTPFYINHVDNATYQLPDERFNGNKHEGKNKVKHSNAIVDVRTDLCQQWFSWKHDAIRNYFTSDIQQSTAPVKLIKAKDDIADYPLAPMWQHYIK